MIINIIVSIPNYHVVKIIIKYGGASVKKKWLEQIGNDENSKKRESIFYRNDNKSRNTFFKNNDDNNNNVPTQRTLWNDKIKGLFNATVELQLSGNRYTQRIDRLYEKRLFVQFDLNIIKSSKFRPGAH